MAYPNVDWMEAIFTPSVYQKHSISASGSTERIKYLMSVSYMDNPGVIDNSTVTRTSYRFNLSSDVTEWLEVGARIYGYRSDTELADISGSMTLLSRGVPCIFFQPLQRFEYHALQQYDRLCQCQTAVEHSLPCVVQLLLEGCPAEAASDLG